MKEQTDQALLLNLRNLKDQKKNEMSVPVIRAVRHKVAVKSPKDTSGKTHLAALARLRN